MSNKKKQRQPSKTPHIKSWPPPAPPAPDRPIGDTSHKQRRPSNTPYTKSSPRPPRPGQVPGNVSWSISSKPKRRFALWGFIKYKWQSLDEETREIRTFIGTMFWFIFWVFSFIFADEISIVFMIPGVILSLIGIAVIAITVKHLVKEAWNKYFPEYQEFKQEYKSKRKTNGEQMDSISDLFEGYEEEGEPDELPGWAAIMKVQIEQHMRQQQAELDQRLADRERGTEH